MVNEDAAKMLREIASLLQEQEANPFRVNAYRRAANTLTSLDKSIKDIVEAEGFSGLTALPGIGEGIARSIYEFVVRGRMARLEALHGENDPVHLFEQIPGVGPILAGKIHDQLHINSLEALEMAAHNGRLQQVPGMGEGRVESIKAWLASVLGHRFRQPRTSGPIEEPPVALLLEVDRVYSKQVLEDKLPKIAPKRFNPSAEAWLPILHTVRHSWHFTAMYSNTQRAHQLHRTRDWVVIYFYDKHHHEGQHTIVTEFRGHMAGKRVVRGREVECNDYYMKTGLA